METHESLRHAGIINRTSDAGFAILFGAIFAAIALLPVFQNKMLDWRVAIVSVAFFAISWLRPELIAPLNKLWFKLGLMISKITTPLLMGVVFFIVITPIAFFFRRRMGVSQKFAFDSTQKSLWTLRSKSEVDQLTLGKQF